MTSIRLATVGFQVSAVIASYNVGSVTAFLIVGRPVWAVVHGAIATYNIVTAVWCRRKLDGLLRQPTALDDMITSLERSASGCAETMKHEIELF